MIVKWFLDGLVTIATAIIGLVPSFARPSWLDGGLATWSSVVGDMEQLNNWVPLGAIGLAATWIFAAWVGQTVLRGARIALSLFTGGGGGAA